MANEVHRKVLLAAGQFTLSTAFNSLGDGDAAQFTQLDLAALEDCVYVDIYWEISTNTSSAPDDGGLLKAYYAEDDEQSTNSIYVADDPLGTSAASYTSAADVEKIEKQCEPIRGLSVSNDTSRVWRWKSRIWYPAKKLTVVLVNATGQALHSSGHAANYKGYGFEVQ